MIAGWLRRLRYWWQGRPWVRCVECGLPVPVDIAPPIRTTTGRRFPNFGRYDDCGDPNSLGGPFLYDRQSPDEGFLYDSSPVGEPVKEPWPPDRIDRVEVAPGVIEDVPIWLTRAVGPTPHARRWVCSLACKEKLDAVILAPSGNVWGGETWKRGL